ncbi:hypothetical protein [Paludibacterium sp.]|uniref:hypothetical protein n=1 Tax=Paludibacterium sp. TaxID=1917523 RepID=UPI0025ED20CD|nr:hypothetical protein [Paludibacterium sp.]MBV8646127.1 hypothetical protein [Paludibacterium sp.]
MLPLELKARLEAHAVAEQLAAITLCRDALQLQLANGVALMLCFASAAEYSMSWRWGDAEMRIDTAPTHPGLASAPNHLHLPDGNVVADPLSHVGAAPWDNAVRLVERLLAAPLLGYEQPSTERAGAWIHPTL